MADGSKTAVPGPPGRGEIERQRAEEKLDGAVADSFPASDPPAATSPSTASERMDPTLRPKSGDDKNEPGKA